VNDAPGFCSVAKTSNQLAVCGAVDSLPIDDDVVETVVNNMLANTDYDAMSGEIHPSIKGALMDNGQKRVDALNHRMHTSHDGQFGAVGSAETADKYSAFWMAGFGSRSETDDTGNTHQMKNVDRGMIMGFDGEVPDSSLRVGFLGGFSQADIDQVDILSSGDVDTWSAGIYATGATGNLTINGGALYNWHSIETDRTVGFGLFAEYLEADYDARSWQAFTEISYRGTMGRLLLDPFAGVSHVSIDTDGFTETGGIMALTAASDTQSTTFTSLGLRTSFQLSEKAQFQATAAWRHAFGDFDPTSTFTISASDPFTVIGAPVAEDAVVGRLGGKFEIADHSTFDLSFVGQYGEDVSEYGVKGNIKVIF